MQMIYISHPYTGNEKENTADAERTRAALQHDNPEECYVNPLSMFGESDGEYYQVLAQCLEVLSRCDEIIFCDGWRESNGCQAEMAFAMQRGIKVEFLNDD